jgi:hypothetical protein
MKKMIPVYLLQIATLAIVAFVGFSVLREVQVLRAETKAELASTKADAGIRQPRSGDAVRVIVMNPVEISR